MSFVKQVVGILAGFALYYAFTEISLLASIASRLHFGAFPQEYIILGICTLLGGFIAAKAGSGSSVGFLLAILTPALPMFEVLIARLIAYQNIQDLVDFSNIYFTWLYMHYTTLLIPIGVGIVTGFIGGFIGSRFFGSAE